MSTTSVDITMVAQRDAGPDPGMPPQTTFEPQPAYIPNDMIILTLDDGPDGVGCGGQSCTVLDSQFFMQQGIKADFFINT